MVIIPLSKLFSIENNKYFFVKASMEAVDKVANIKDYPEKDFYWKVVPNILKLQLENKIHAQYKSDIVIDADKEIVEKNEGIIVEKNDEEIVEKNEDVITEKKGKNK